MSTLLLRLAAPLQSWGVGAKFERRETQRLPTKSGVVGLIAAALGRRRDEGIEDLNALKMGVRADQEGELLRDYHTARTGTATYVTNRYYLCDAVFLVGLEGDPLLLAQIEEALRKPRFPLFLGRRSCPPEGRVCLGLREGVGLKDALAGEPWLASPWYRQANAASKSLPLLLEAGPGEPGSFLQRDVPISFSQARRRHGFRNLSAGQVRLPGAETAALSNGLEATGHDAFWEGGD